MGRITELLLLANLAIERIERAQRQQKRLEKAYRKQSREFQRVTASNGGTPPPSMPSSWVVTEHRFQDHLYFFVLTARQAIKAAWVLRDLGESMPEMVHEDEVRAWRDFSEHWEAPFRGKTLMAKDAWQQISKHDEPGLSYSEYDGLLVEVSGVDLRELKKDLERAREAAGQISEREWLYCYITADEAAEVLGISCADFEAMDPKPLHLDFGADGGVRYWRDWVESFRDGHPYPPSWQEFGFSAHLKPPSAQDP
jgi:hypothetical protein